LERAKAYHGGRSVRKLLELFSALEWKDMKQELSSLEQIVRKWLSLDGKVAGSVLGI